MKKIILTIFLSIVATTLFAQSDDFLENGTVTFRRHNCQEHLHSKLDSRAVSDSTYRLMPHVGNPRVLVILAEFSDKTFSVNQPRKAFHQFFNHPTTPDNLYTEGVDVVNYHNNLNYSSVATYFADQSNGQFTPQFDIYGPVKLPHNCQYYGGNNEDNNNDERPYDMTEDALTLLADSIDDISIYDSNNDGFIDCVFIVYAGFSQNQGGAANTVWACNFNIGSMTITDKHKQTRKASLAACSGELVTINSKGTLYKVISGIGVPCHEFSHALGLPDIYPTSSPADKTDNQEMEYWDLMDGGEYVRNGFCPAPYTAWEKWQMGWDNSNIQTLTEANAYTMTPYTQPGAVAYKIENPGNSNEYILLEYVAHEGWAKYMPAEGLLAYHVVDNGDITRSSRYNNNAGKPRMAIIPADSICANYYNVEKEEYNASLTHDLFPNNGYITALNDTMALPNFYWYTNPGTGLKSKTNSNFYAVNQALKDITMDENGLSFTYIPDFATGIKGITNISEPEDKRIFTLDGRYVGKNIDVLPKGIYVRNKRKIVK